MTSENTFDTEKFREKFKEAMDKLAKQPPHPFNIHPFDTQPTHPHVCPNCGHCPTCGRRDIMPIPMPRRPLPWEYRTNPYLSFGNWKQPDKVMCVG